MINWNVAIKEVKTINKIAERVINLYPQIKFLNIQMDITAAHLKCPLMLDELLAADESNFMHDIAGIVNNINRNTGKLENCFLPRYAKKQ